MRREELYLADIVEAADIVTESIQDVDRDAFLANREKRDAVLLKLIIIWEAAARVPKALRKRHPEVQWDEIITFRNLAVHLYFSIDWELVWLTASERVPKLKCLVADILAKEFPDRLPFAEGE